MRQSTLGLMTKFIHDTVNLQLKTLFYDNYLMVILAVIVEDAK